MDYLPNGPQPCSFPFEDSAPKHLSLRAKVDIVVVSASKHVSVPSTLVFVLALYHPSLLL